MMRVHERLMMIAAATAACVLASLPARALEQPTTIDVLDSPCVTVTKGPIVENSMTVLANFKIIFPSTCGCRSALLKAQIFARREGHSDLKTLLSKPHAVVPNIRIAQSLQTEGHTLSFKTLKGHESGRYAVAIGCADGA
jgi:hypothetical protein